MISVDSFLLLASFTALAAIYDALVLKTRPILNHAARGRVAFRMLFIALNSFFAPQSVLFQCAYFWLFFDLSLNSLRGQKLLYVGNTSKIDRYFRALEAKGKKPYMLYTKLAALFLGIILMLAWK